MSLLDKPETSPPQSPPQSPSEPEASSPNSPSSVGSSVQPASSPSVAPPSSSGESSGKASGESSGVAAFTRARTKIHARPVVGPLRRWRWVISTTLQAILFLGPWLTWDGRQAILFDIAERRFHFFGLNIWPQEMYLLHILLIAAAVLLFASTAVAGRMWCGYACPQTLLTEMFVVVERHLEGDRMAAARLDRASWTGRKVALKGTVLAIWTVMALWLGVTFTAYFQPAHELLQSLMLGQATSTQGGSILLFAAFALFAYGYFREQACHYVCPYARFQGAMFDRNTLLVAYDARRGEPRGKVSTPNAGDCVDCKACVVACPMGIDIRKGNQFECITCTACIDACDTVMDRLQRPRGLVRYTSLNQLEGKPWSLLRPRVVAYGLLLAGLAVLLVTLLLRRPLLELATVRAAAGQEKVWSMASDGRVANTYRVKLINKDTRPHAVLLSLQGLEGATLLVPQNPRTLAPDSAVDVMALVLQAKDDARTVVPFDFCVVELAAPTTPQLQATSRASFIGPGSVGR